MNMTPKFKSNVSAADMKRNRKRFFSNIFLMFIIKNNTINGIIISTDNTWHSIMPLNPNIIGNASEKVRLSAALSNAL